MSDQANSKPDSKFSRRTLLKVGLGAIAVSVVGTASAQKMAPNLVMYQATPKDGHQCDQCVQWVAPDSCAVVEGKISPKGWCAAFAPKAP
ncbi:MAG: high-potential iron-sulfur protein [Panacagrimonas sp.]